MTITIYHQWSDLDDCNRFGIDTHKLGDVMAAWVWFYIGRNLKTPDAHLFPWAIAGGKPVKEFKCVDAEATARKIINLIERYEKSVGVR